MIKSIRDATVRVAACRVAACFGVALALSVALTTKTWQVLESPSGNLCTVRLPPSINIWICVDIRYAYSTDVMLHTQHRHRLYAARSAHTQLPDVRGPRIT